VPGGLIHLSRLKCADPVRDRSSTIACHAAPRSERATNRRTGHHILPDALKGILSNPPRTWRVDATDRDGSSDEHGGGRREIERRVRAAGPYRENEP
jgi:hypothetical protein